MVKIETPYVRQCLMNTLAKMDTNRLIEHIIYCGDLDVFDNDELTREERDDYYNGVYAPLAESEMKQIIQDWLKKQTFD